MGCAALLFGRFADVQELCFKSENRSDTCCDEVHWCPFAYCQIWYFQSAKCSNKRSTILQDVRFADAQDLTFQASKRSNMRNAVLLSGRNNNVKELCFETAKRSDMRL